MSPWTCAAGISLGTALCKDRARLGAFKRESLASVAREVPIALCFLEFVSATEPSKNRR